MYKTPSDKITYSPSDLILFMRSPFASWMQRFAIEDPSAVANIERTKDPMMALLAGQGDKHEENYLKQLQDEFGKENVAIITDDKRTAAKDTLTAMKDGYPVIFQAYLERDNFAGSADFLVKCNGDSRLGNYYYEAWDTKLSKSTRPYFILQLCCYSWMLENIQNRLPEEATIVLGNRTKDNYRIAAYYHYFHRLKDTFISNQNSFVADLSQVPDPAFSNNYGQWETFAKQLLKETDNLALVANIRKNQIQKLHAVGISCLTQLANTDIDQISGISPDTFRKLKAQANIQLISRGKDKPPFKILQEDNNKGLSALPPATSLDVFFDIEGHPLMEGGLEYLWGVSFVDKNAVKGNVYAFRDWWGHNREQETQAFEGFIDWAYERWQKNPAMHIYHYASYEITAIGKISSREQTRIEQVRELLRYGVFIDLYKIVINGLIIGETRYSIKNVEHLYRSKRTTDVASGGESVVFYENWREQGGAEGWAEQENGHKSWMSNPGHFNWEDWETLKQIRDYNIDDCESTLELVDWLRTQQQNAGIRYQTPEATEENNKTDRQVKNQEKREALVRRQQALIDKFHGSNTLKQDHRAELLIDLLHFYVRENKPQAWEYYERLTKSSEALFEDDTVVHDISIISTSKEDNHLLCTAIYNLDQPIRTDKVKTAVIQDRDVNVTKIEYVKHNAHQGVVNFVIKAAEEDALQQSPLTLFGNEPNIDTSSLEHRLCEITEQYFNSGAVSGAVTTILNQGNPNFTAQSALPVTRQLYPGDEYMDAIIKTIQALDSSCLCIQGPPGSGKTYTAKHIINALVKQGKRIGIMSNSHAAIMNLLIDVSKIMPHINVAKVGGYKNQTDFREDYSKDEYPSLILRTTMSFTKAQPYETFQVVGATAYAFVKDIAYESPLDYLFVDEASQVALANLIAISGCTDNIILIGDQMQMEQPIQGVHPGKSASSALEYMLKGHSVIAEDKGIFLERSYRMHPDICKPLSDVVYEGKLQADEDNKRQAVHIDKPNKITQENGILSINVKHEGNTQSSEEEVVIIQSLIDELKTGTFTSKNKELFPITDKDILVIAPYNMQVNLLKERLCGDIEIGTIDKFQGQQAPVVIISMSVSNIDDSPRGLSFIFDINRLNVAVSRAQALAIIVSNEGLEQCGVNNLAQMEQVGFFLALSAAVNSR